MKAVRAIMGGVGLIAFLAGQAQALMFIQDFDSGYVSGPLSSQNSWSTFAPYSSLNVNLTAGVGGSPGVVATSPGSSTIGGNYITHGLPVGGLMRLTGQVFAGSDFMSIELRNASLSSYLALEVCNDGVLANEGFRMEMSQNGYAAVSNFGAVDVNDEWYSFELDWVVGGGATFTAKDSANNIVFSDTIDTSGVITNPGDLTVLTVYQNPYSAHADGAFDNLVLVPEPGSGCLFVVGVAGAAASKRRRASS